MRDFDADVYPRTSMPDANGVMQMRHTEGDSERGRRGGGGDAFIGIGRRSSVILMRLIVA